MFVEELQQEKNTTTVTGNEKHKNDRLVKVPLKNLVWFSIHDLKGKVHSLLPKE